MTAVNFVAQRELGLLYLVGDAALYTDDGIVGFGTKAFPIPHWPGVVTSMGNANAAVLFASVLSMVDEFDTLIEAAPTLLPTLVSASDLPEGAQVLVAGISKKRGPEAYVFRVNNDLPRDVQRDKFEASDYWGDAPGTLTKLPDYVMAPVPSVEIVMASGWEGIDLKADPETMAWTLRKHLEMQRQTPPVTRDSAAGYNVGGFGYLITVSADGISQRILQRWPDKAGSKLYPAPINWDQWHRDNPKPKRGNVHQLRIARH